MADVKVLHTERFTHPATAEEKDKQGRVTRCAVTARDELVVALRADRQYTMLARVPPGFPADVTKALADVALKVSLGEEIAVGVRVVEYEERLVHAIEATVTRERTIEDLASPTGVSVVPEEFTPAAPERVDHVFTLRVDGIHLYKGALRVDEFAAPSWRATLANKARVELGG